MCTKHINIRYHFICQVVASHNIDVMYCLTSDMTADILTKVLPRWKVACHVLGLGLHCASGGVLEFQRLEGMHTHGGT